jgi:coproporphyrinogen III oxidase-like Fe-S oxidoreductase
VPNRSRSWRTRTRAAAFAAILLAIGVGAVGTVGGARWRNASSIERYVRRAGAPDREWDERTPEARATEAISTRSFWTSSASSQACGTTTSPIETAIG